jgi:deoxyribonuclease V
MTALRDGRETVGKAVRTRDGIKPVYVSAGHRIDLASAARLVLRCCRGYRLPEPTRQAHLCVNVLRRDNER